MIERRTLPSGRTSYRVRYYGPDRRERSRSFARRRDAEAYEAQMATEMRRGEWVDPRRGAVPLTAVWQEFECAGIAHLRVTTQANYRAAWRNIEPGFGSWPVNRIEHADVAAWVQQLGRDRGAETVRMAHRVLCWCWTTPPRRGVSRSTRRAACDCRGRRRPVRCS